MTQDELRAYWRNRKRIDRAARTPEQHAAALAYQRAYQQEARRLPSKLQHLAADLRQARGKNDD